MTDSNHLGEILAFTPPQMPPLDLVLTGRTVRLEPMSVSHAPDLEQEFHGHDALWDYMPSGPFASVAAFTLWIESRAAQPDPMFMTICDVKTGHPLGIASFMRIVPKDGVIEVGGVAYTPALQGTVMATEAMYLMMRWAFDAGYRRYEWKCHAMNRPSRRAAQRLGFSYEGLFRQHMIIKGRNRDTAWFSVIDSEWPKLKNAFETWLSPSNFNAHDDQTISLSELTVDLLKTLDPGT